MGTLSTLSRYPRASSGPDFLTRVSGMPPSVKTVPGYGPNLWLPQDASYKPKDIFIWKIFYKGVNKNDRNHGREAFFKIINMSTTHHINTQIKLGSNATIKSTATFIQNQVKNILTHYQKSRLAHILSKQEILDGILMSGFSPTVWSSMLLYETIDLF